MRKTILRVLPVLTFLAGLGAGALVRPGLPPDGSEPAPAVSAEDATVERPLSAAVRLAGAADRGDDPIREEVRSDEVAAPNTADGAKAEVDAAALSARLDELAQGWGRMEARLAGLAQRVAMLERAPVVEAGADEGDDERAGRRPRTPEAQREALVRAGVAAGAADEILWRQAQVELDRLDLRDQASREGWLNTDRYREAVRELNAERVSLRDELGAAAYDRYLYETGADNRVSVDSVIPGSAGDQSGMLPGDVIESYGDAQVLDFGDLRQATSDGERGELVPVQVRRAGGLVELWLPRGPIGIRLDSARVEPGS
jgi:hypothetical protein